MVSLPDALVDELLDEKRFYSAAAIVFAVARYQDEAAPLGFDAILERTSLTRGGFAPVFKYCLEREWLDGIPTKEGGKRKHYRIAARFAVDECAGEVDRREVSNEPGAIRRKKLEADLVERATRMVTIKLVLYCAQSAPNPTKPLGFRGLAGRLGVNLNSIRDAVDEAIARGWIVSAPSELEKQKTEFAIAPKWIKTNRADTSLPGLAARAAPMVAREIRQKRNIPNTLRRAVFQRDEYRCLRCGATERLCADHVIPERHDGETSLENLQTLCKPCNSQKGARSSADYRAVEVQP